MTNFRLFQTERVCRWQIQIWWKWNKVIQMGRKHCGKRRNCSLRAISSFPTVFSKGFFPGASKGVVVWEWVIKQGLLKGQILRFSDLAFFSFNRQKIFSKVYMNIIFAITTHLLAINHGRIVEIFYGSKILHRIAYFPWFFSLLRHSGRSHSFMKQYTCKGFW